MLAHLYTIQRQFAANFLFQITPSEHILEVALASISEKAFPAIYRLGEILFVERDKGRWKRKLLQFFNVIQS